MQWFTQMEDEFFTDEAAARLAEAAPASERAQSAPSRRVRAAADAAAAGERAADVATLVKHRDDAARARGLGAIAPPRRPARTARRGARRPATGARPCRRGRAGRARPALAASDELALAFRAPPRGDTLAHVAARLGWGDAALELGARLRARLADVPNADGDRAAHRGRARRPARVPRARRRGRAREPARRARPHAARARGRARARRRRRLAARERRDRARRHGRRARGGHARRAARARVRHAIPYKRGPGLTGAFHSLLAVTVGDDDASATTHVREGRALRRPGGGAGGGVAGGAAPRRARAAAAPPTPTSRRGTACTPSRWEEVAPNVHGARARARGRGAARRRHALRAARARGRDRAVRPHPPNCHHAARAAFNACARARRATAAELRTRRTPPSRRAARRRRRRRALRRLAERHVALGRSRPPLPGPRTTAATGRQRRRRTTAASTRPRRSRCTTKRPPSPSRSTRRVSRPARPRRSRGCHGRPHVVYAPSMAATDDPAHAPPRTEIATGARPIVIDDGVEKASLATPHKADDEWRATHTEQIQTRVKAWGRESYVVI